MNSRFLPKVSAKEFALREALNAIAAATSLVDHLDSNYLSSDVFAQDEEFIRLFQEFHSSLADVKSSIIAIT